MFLYNRNLGINVIINERLKVCCIRMRYMMMLFGRRMRGYIKNIRPDNKIDVHYKFKDIKVSNPMQI
jgi:hypothetical protein